MMADDPEPDGKNEVTKDVLAPADGPREEMISTAIKFLQNPKVKQSPLHQKKAFLQRKGLTSEEIDIAVQRSGVGQDENVTQVFPPQPPGQVAPYQYSGAALPQPPMLEYTRWQKTRDILSMIALASGVTYAAYKFFKEIIHPWWTGKPRTSDRLDRVEKCVTELQTSVVDTLSKLQECLTAVQEQMARDQEKVQNLSHEIYTVKGNETLQLSQESQSLNEIKSDLTSIKGLLLNRKQFPPTPLSTPTLPSWQLTATSSTSSLTAEKPSLVTPSGDAGVDMTDALAMLNSNENIRTEEDDDMTNSPTVTFSDTSIVDSHQIEAKVTEEPVINSKSSDIEVMEPKVIGQENTTITKSETKSSEDELD